MDLEGALALLNTGDQRVDGRTAIGNGAGIEEGKRSFKIHRAKPDGKSYARDIAGKYGLTYEEILLKLDRPNS